MVDPNWSLLQGNQSQQYFNNGAQLGSHVATTQRARELDNALASYVTNPQDQAAFGKITQLDPRMGMQLQEREAQRKAAEAKAGQEKAMTVAKLFDNVTPENYQQRLSVAQRMGIDTTGAPQQFDPNWVAENRIIMQTVAERPEALSTAGKIAVDEGYQPGTAEFNSRVKQIVVSEATKPIPYQPGGGVATYNAQTGQTQVIVQPNYGDQPAGAPAPAAPKGNIPTIKTPAEAKKLKPGTQFYDDKGVLRMVPGGASSNASGGFRPVNDGVGALKRVFPNARVTSGYRDANHPLSKKNPDSFHTRTRAAADMAPIPGMTFEQAKAKFEAAGYYVHPDSRDEVNNPSSHATGPHWHFVIGER